jgi:nucleoside-diphosphate-sugar epimerase
MDTNKTALVLGASGKIGGEVAATLRRRGWAVRAMRRELPARNDGISWVRGDAMNAADVLAAASGASLIVHAVNPLRYLKWGELVLPMLDSSIAAAAATGARVLLPGTVYNYGPDAFAVLRETSPQAPRTRKGAIRVAMEERLARAGSLGVRSLVVRAGDYFGGGGGGSWFSDGLLGGGSGKALRAITYPGARGVGHAWAYLPDLAEAMVRLVERDTGTAGLETWHFAGHFDPDGTAMVDAIRRALGRPELPVKRFPWALLALASPVVPFFREMQEMRYLWRVPLQLDNTKLAAALGAEPHTPLDAAVTAALRDRGYLGDSRETASAFGMAH